MKTFTLETRNRNELIDITGHIENIVRELSISSGIITVFTPHTTSAITINEGADPDVKDDIIRKLNALFPQNDNYRHMEGNSDSHLKSSVIGASEQIIVENGKLVLGTWQSIYFCEFDGPRTRKVFVSSTV